MTTSAETRASGFQRVKLFLLAAALALPGCSTVNNALSPIIGGGPPVGAPGFVRGFLGGVATEDPAAALIARNVLSSGGTATDAAVAAGFADQSHMTRIFVRKYGLTPGAYARALR